MEREKDLAWSEVPQIAVAPPASRPPFAGRCPSCSQEHGQDRLQCLVLRPSEYMEAPASTLHQESIQLVRGGCWLGGLPVSQAV